ncbi:hypothetical protein KI387_043485, partial [Taxus chinensis]
EYGHLLKDCPLKGPEPPEEEKTQDDFIIPKKKKTTCKSVPGNEDGSHSNRFATLQQENENQDNGDITEPQVPETQMAKTDKLAVQLVIEEQNQLIIFQAPHKQEEVRATMKSYQRKTKFRE